MLAANLVALWTEGRTRFSNQLSSITEADLTKRLGTAPNSAGFLIRHIADVELLFSKNVFKAAGLQVHAKTVIAQKDTGEWTNLEELLSYQQTAFETLRAVLLNQPDTAWEEIITTHTTYHAGQLAIILKYGM